MNDQTNEEKILRVPLAEVMPSPLNPRTTFDESKLAEMAKSVEAKGVMNPLLTRPACASDVARGFKYEIIAGERRYRASQQVGLETVPIIVREISDADALEMMLIENLQREDLNPIEEARGIEQMLALTDEKGAPMHTELLIAQKIGRSQQHVENTVRLLLIPAKFHGDVSSGKLGRTLCYLAAAIPDKKLREQAIGEIARGYGQGPMTTRQAKDHITRNYMTELRGSPFDQNDAGLVPMKEEDGKRVLGGACGDCAFNSANRAQGDAEGGQFKMCINPACYQLKVDGHVRAALTKAEAEGKKVITGKAAEKVISWDGDVSSVSGKVRLNAKPDGEVVAGKKTPTWGKMLKGEVQPTIEVVIDKKGRVFEVVDRNEAIEAAKSNGFKDLFTASASKKKGRSDDDKKEAERLAKERREQKIQGEVTRRVMAAIVEGVERDGFGDREWAELLETAIGHAGSDGRNWVIQRRDIPAVNHKESYYKDRMDPEATLKKYGKELEPVQMRGFVIELLLSQGVRWQGLAHNGTKKLMHFFKVDEAAETKAVREEMAAGKKSAGKDIDGGSPRRKKAAKADKSKACKASKCGAKLS